MLSLLIYRKRSEGLFRPAGVDSLSLFEDTSTELGGGAGLLELLQTLLRILSKQETLQRMEESALHELLLLLGAVLRLQAEDLRHLLLQVAEQLRPAVCSLQPFLRDKREQGHDWFCDDSHLTPPSETNSSHSGAQINICLFRTASWYRTDQSINFADC